MSAIRPTDNASLAGPAAPAAPPDPSTAPSTAPSATATASATASAKATATMSPAEAKRLHQAKDAAQKFEAIFLRQMLSGLEKTNNIGKSGSPQGGAGGIYGSMMVNSLAESISRSGGIGLADVIVRALQGSHPTGAPKK
jgi:peptidoglycan hydrolase FlgJ